MAIVKQNISVNFAKGLDTKTDPWQVDIGSFLMLQNSVFNKGGQLTKRNGFALVTTPPEEATSISTYKDGLVAMGESLQAYIADSDKWINTGSITTISLDVVPLVRTSTSQTNIDAAVAPNGLVVETWLDSNGTSYYQVSDSVTGQIVRVQTALEATAVMSRAFSLGNYLIVTYFATIAAATHLRYIAIPIYDPNSPTVPADLSSVVDSLTAGYDGYVSDGILYVAFSASAATVRLTSLNSTLAQDGTTIIAGNNATRVSVTVDSSGATPIIWVTFLATGSNNVYTQNFTITLVPLLASTLVYAATPVNNLTSVATGQLLTLLTEMPNTYTYTPAPPGSAITNFVQMITVTQAGVVGSPSVIRRGVGLGSKSFFIGPKIYTLMIYGQPRQPTYFMIDTDGNIVGKLAYSNGGGYITTQILPGVSVYGSVAQIGYLFVDLLVPVNKAQGASVLAQVYTQTGINLAAFTFNVVASTLEIGNDLHITGGFMWMYDGISPVEHQFHVWPEDILVTTTTPGAVQYFYVVTYEWTDASGNIHRSAPSIPMGVLSTVTPSNTVNVPMLRLTAKTNVRIVLYRWSQNKQSYFQVGGPTFLNVNDPTTDSIAIVDTFTDDQILGNLLVYTTGGVIEDIAAPGTDIFTLFKSRLFLVDSEDRNLIWFSKQVIEAVPVEMSDLLTIFVAPTLGSQGSTGPITALSNMDDKLIIFKANAIYYITGTGPDNTGANNDFSDPIFISSAAGCTNTKSIVQTPNGLMFQSNKGIWLLGRDLNTTYIGAPVEAYNNIPINAATTVPGTNQVRFELTTISGVSDLVYDYFFGQWSTFVKFPGTSSVIYKNLQTYLDIFGRILQEAPGTYQDVSTPVLLSFVTSWIKFGGFQGYQRAHFFYLIGQFLSPHKLNIRIAYEFNPSPRDSAIITANTFGRAYGGNGSDAQNPYGQQDPMGGGPSGGDSYAENWRIFFKKQRCQSFQILVDEIYDPRFNLPPGAGVALSGLNIVASVKKGWRPIGQGHTVGTT